MGLRGLGIGDRLDGVGLFALLGLGLLELALGGQRIVAGHGADDFLRLALDRVDQTLTCLVGLLVLTHLKSPFGYRSSAGGCSGCQARRGPRAGVVGVVAPLESGESDADEEGPPGPTGPALSLSWSLAVPLSSANVLMVDDGAGALAASHW